jgi:hypothetical protein
MAHENQARTDKHGQQDGKPGQQGGQTTPDRNDEEAPAPPGAFSRAAGRGAMRRTY